MTHRISNRNTDEIPDSLILAAIARAERHRQSRTDAPGAPTWDIAAHLDIPVRSGPARRVKARLASLEKQGSITAGRRHGVQVWALTEAGRADLAEDASASLPESPQHRRWRSANTLATQEIERIRAALLDLLEEASGLLVSRQEISSDRWFEIAEQLREAAWRVGSATYCLNEWSEPNEETADIDERTNPGEAQLTEDERRRRYTLRAGRRNTGRWQEGVRS
jgi:hypothetical protein